MATEGGRKWNPTMCLKGERTKNIQWTALIATTHDLVNVTLLPTEDIGTKEDPKGINSNIVPYKGVEYVISIGNVKKEM